MTDAANRRAAFLNEMGLGPLWISRAAESAAVEPAPADAAPQAAAAADIQTAHVATEKIPVAWETSPIAQQPSDMTRATRAPVASATEPSATEIAEMDWARLKTVVAGCTKCDLCHGRTQTVFGVGDEKARWLFVGEGPGRNEDLQGQPFVGPAGKLLDNMLLSMGLRRGENTFIANIVKCRPTDANGRDRPPNPEEVAACMPYLERQIALLQPTVIVALGKTAALSLLKLDPATPVSKLRGTVYRYADLPLVVTYHPAYLLRNLKDKSKAWADLCLAMQTYAGSASH